MPIKFYLIDYQLDAFFANNQKNVIISI